MDNTAKSTASASTVTDSDMDDSNFFLSDPDDERNNYADADGEIKMLMESEIGSLDELGGGGGEGEMPVVTKKIERAISVSLSKMNLGTVEVEIDNEENSVRSAEAEQGSSKSDRHLPSLSVVSAYGHPLSSEEASRRVPAGEGGLHWHSLLINGDPFDISTGKLKRGLNSRDFDLDTQRIKPRRASLPILAKDFYASLTRVEDERGQPRFIFHGILNGWPSLQTMEVIRVQRKRTKELWGPTALLTGQRVWAHMWSAAKEGAKGEDPILKEKGLLFRITFRSPAWSSRGWSPTSPGFAFWYEPQEQPEPLLTYGTDMMRHMEESKDAGSLCTLVHMMAHRYARVHENPKDKLTYHSVVLLEWDHGKYCTVVEAAYLNGLGGYRGKSNFYHDLNYPVTQLYKSFPPELVCPWLTNAAEIRAFECPHLKSLDDFKSFVAQYSGGNQRFLDPQYPFSHPVRLAYRSKKDIARYLNNYIRRDISYSQLTRNCQTLSADLCAFLAGKREVLPYHPVNRIEYRNRTHLFLYEPDLFNPKIIQESWGGRFHVT